MLTVYYNKACNTCRTLEELLKQQKVSFRLRPYLDEPLSYEEAKALHQLVGGRVRDMLRDKDCEELGIEDNASDESLLRALSQNPRLLRRPIVSDGKRASVIRPANAILEWLEDA